MNPIFIERIAQQTHLQNWQIENTLRLFEEGATLPFVARYRKERTGNLDEVQLEKIRKTYQQLTELEKRKTTILSAISEQGKLTPALEQEIRSTWDETHLEDLYLPYKSRKKTKADIALEKGLEPLAKILLAQRGHSLAAIAEKYLTPQCADVDEAIQGAKDIAAQWIAEKTIIRERLRKLFMTKGVITSKLVKGKEAEAEKYTDYFNFTEPARYIKSHRLLALLRGEKEGFLKISALPPTADALESITYIVLKKEGDFTEELTEVCADAYTRLLKPSLETELFNELKNKADQEAISVFADNLRQLLLQPPLGQQRILAIDPGYRTGCKVVCLDAQGNLLHNETIFPHPPQKEIAQAKKKLATLVGQYKIEAIAIGNGTASRETEFFVKSTQFDRALKVFVVNEAGASIYSASKEAREEFPQYDVTVRGAISIGRRLMDPLAELVKIDPKSIGVGQYQHDVNQKELQDRLDRVVESCVNTVGVDVNTASRYLLQYVAGIGPQLAQNIIEHRTEYGAFQNRNELKNVPKLGAKAFEQCAGFLRIRNGNNPLDNSSVHPESYAVTKKMCSSINASLEDIIGNAELISTIPIQSFVSDTSGINTLTDIIEELKKPGRDPRKLVKVFEFSKEIRNIEDVKPGMVLPGIVNNITNFGAFVDIGIKENGLIHISNLTDSFVSNPNEVIKLHEHVQCEVIQVEAERKRIGLKLIKN
jgi:protein Tex